MTIPRVSPYQTILFVVIGCLLKLRIGHESVLNPQLRASALGRRRQRLLLRALDDEPEHDGKFAEEQWLRIEERLAA